MNRDPGTGIHRRDYGGYRGRQLRWCGCAEVWHRHVAFLQVTLRQALRDMGAGMKIDEQANPATLQRCQIAFTPWVGAEEHPARWINPGPRIRHDSQRTQRITQLGPERNIRRGKGLNVDHIAKRHIHGSGLTL